MIRSLARITGYQITAENGARLRPSMTEASPSDVLIVLRRIGDLIGVPPVRFETARDGRISLGCLVAKPVRKS